MSTTPWSTLPGKKSAHVVLRRKNTTTGEYEFLLQHRALQGWAEALPRMEQIKKGQNVLGIPGGTAGPQDANPAVTAWRELLEECFAHSGTAPHAPFTLPAFHQATVQCIRVAEARFIFVVDVSSLACLSAEWAGMPPEPGSSASKEINTRKWATGHFWAGESEMDHALQKQARNRDSQFLGLRGEIVWRVVGEQMRMLRYGFGITRPIYLYHGCPVNALAGLSEGDLGKGVYFTGARQAKAIAMNTSTDAMPHAFIVDKENNVSKSRPTVNTFQVVLGECKVITRFDTTRCGCGCDAPYMDHEQRWNVSQRFNSVMRLAGAGTPHFQVCLPMPAMEFVEEEECEDASVEGEIQ